LKPSPGVSALGGQNGVNDFGFFVLDDIGILPVSIGYQEDIESTLSLSLYE
jgi:hypothetical protein